MGVVILCSKARLEQPPKASPRYFRMPCPGKYRSLSVLWYHLGCSASILDQLRAPNATTFATNTQILTNFHPAFHNASCFKIPRRPSDPPAHVLCLKRAKSHQVKVRGLRSPISGLQLASAGHEGVNNAPGPPTEASTSRPSHSA